VSFLYVLQAKGTDLFKIGITESTPDKRIKEIQTGCPYKIETRVAFEVSTARDEEKYWHTKFKENRLNGEWFRLEKAQLREIQAHYKKPVVTDAINYVELTANGNQKVWAYLPASDVVLAPIEIIPDRLTRIIATSSGVAQISLTMGVFIPVEKAIDLIDRTTTPSDWKKMRLSREKSFEQIRKAAEAVRREIQESDWVEEAFA
jgi:hypothetical protein